MPAEGRTLLLLAEGPGKHLLSPHCSASLSHLTPWVSLSLWLVRAHAWSDQPSQYSQPLSASSDYSPPLPGGTPRPSLLALAVPAQLQVATVLEPSRAPLAPTAGSGLPALPSLRNTHSSANLLCLLPVCYLLATSCVPGSEFIPPLRFSLEGFWFFVLRETRTIIQASCVGEKIPLTAAS